MRQPEANRITISENDDLVRARARVRDVAVEMGFSHLDQVRLVTAVSELAQRQARFASEVRGPGAGNPGHRISHD
jgi:anti-sigma regulatory factor (Ser/Thr protein kinase)